MAINRRFFLAGAAALGLTTDLRAAPAPVRLIASTRNAQGTDEFTMWTRHGQIETGLSGRGHGLARFGTSDLYAVAARRPGHFIDIMDASGEVLESHAPAADHIFAGHIAPIGRTRNFIATEIDDRTSRGFAVLRAVGSKTPMAQWETHGLGPHDLTFLAGGSRLVVANGGLETAQDRPGSTVDPDTIESSLAILDAADGRLIRCIALDNSLRSLSIRHMAVAPDEQSVAFGMQDKKKDGWRPLVGVMDAEGRFNLLDAPREDRDSLKAYVGSLAIDAGGTYLAATSPRGGRIEAWTLRNGRSVGGLSLGDVCGLAADSAPGCFWATSGLGDIKRIAVTPAGIEVKESFHVPLAFDNHLLRI